MKKSLSVPEVAARFDVTSQAVRNWIALGRLQAVQPMPRGRYRIPLDAFRAFERDATAPPMSATRVAGMELSRVVDAIVAATNPTSVILFGSRARGDAGRDSDFDLAVLSPDGVSRRRLAMRAYEGIAAVEDRTIGVDIVVLTPGIIAAERDVPGSLTRAVVQDGVPIYGPAIVG